MIDVKRLSGIMNLDDKAEDILPHQHVQALNLRFYGGSNGLTAENVVGNTLVANSYKPAGQNSCIGAFYDGVKQRLIFFNWNSNARHGIYQYSIATGLITPLLVCFTNSQTDILGFDLDYPAASINVIYTTDTDGDILTWVTRNKRPKCLNLLQAANNTYGANWLERYLDVAKEPPYIPIKCAYEDDATVTVNNLRKKLFKFKYRYWYSDNQKSTWSSESEIPVPFNYVDPEVDTDPTKNCRIGMVVQTGDESVVKVEIAACESLGNVFSNYFSTIILNKADLAIPDDTMYLWRFYNNEAYVYVDLQESVLLFDRVPDVANTQELLNGNVIVYGGITEGLDPVVPEVEMTVGTEYPLCIDYTNVFSVTQAGTNGFVTGSSIKFVVIGHISMGQTFTALVAVGVTVYTITYTAVVGDTPATVLAGLSTSATGQGFTQSSINANELVIIRGNQVLQRSLITTTNQSINGSFVINLAAKTVTLVAGSQYLSLFTKGVLFYIYGNTLNVNPFVVVSASVAATNLIIVVENALANETITTDLYFLPPVNSSIPAYNSSSKENWGLAYFENKGKTNEVTTRVDFNVNTNSLGLQQSVNTLLFLTPYITAQINHRPPLWATTYQWVRSANLTKQSWLYWISSGTYKDEKYGYISIESINAYKVVNPSSVISYDFLPGDRIKFYVLYSTTGNPIQTYTNQHDYEIFDSVVNPDINGTVRPGQFIKIILPTLTTAFDFSTGLTLDYNNYYIELYTPAKSAAEGLDVYYEFSEEYAIIDPGTANRCHQGQTQNQSADLIIPAAFKFNKGDAWYRPRRIPIGNTILYDMVNGPAFGTGTILGQKLKTQAYSTPEYVVAGTINQQAFVNSFNSPGWTINVLLNTYTFKVKGALNFNVTVASSSAFRVQIYVVQGTTTITYLLGGSGAPVTVGQQVIMNVDTSIIMPPNSKAFVVMNNLDGNFRCNLVSGYLSYSEPQKDFIVPVIDQNFSDFYASKVNSDGRPMKVNPDEKTNFFGTLLRWGLEYQQNTNINQVNRFPADTFDEIDRSKGDIQRFKTRDRMLRIFQNLAVGQYGVYAKYLQSTTGDVNVTTTNDILTKGNISYYAGHLGLGDQYTSLISNINIDYGVHTITGDHWRLSDNGFTKIGELYKGEYVIKSLLIPYNKTYTQTNGSKAKILGCYNPFDEEAIQLLQGGTNGSSTISSYAFSFNEKRNGYCSFFSYTDAEWVTNIEDRIVSFKDGDLWIHDNTTTRANFFGSQYSASITLVFNMNLLEVKSWMSLTEVASEIWRCPIIFTSVKSHTNQRQESELINQHFANLEGEFKAAFRRDIHSNGGLYNGSYLKGNLMVVKFQIDNASNLVSLSEVSVMVKDSPLNVR